jgi:ubiquinone/menaquinone biosynthesis C-methylase UbiE
MDEPSLRFLEILFEIFGSPPRQGPGNLASARKALRHYENLPDAPEILDLCCGTEGQTLQLAELTQGSVIAVDQHSVSIEKLSQKLVQLGLTNRIQAQVGDMAELNMAQSSFDLIWSEGALYNIGIPRALSICAGLLRKGGYLVFTDAVWCRANPPDAVKAIFESDYPTMGTVADLVSLIESSPFELLNHFPLPPEAWWDDFYTPMERIIEEFLGKYADDPEALEILKQLAIEPAAHRKNSDYYNYEFFITRKV